MDRRRRAGNSGDYMRNCLRAASCGLTLALGLAAAGASAQPAASAAKDAVTDNAINTTERAKDAAPNGADADGQFFRQRLANAHSLARSSRYQLADRAFAEAFAQPAFAALPAADRHSALAAAAETAVMVGDLPRAAGLYRQATEAADEPEDWYRVALIEFDLDRFEPSAQAFIHLVEHWPEVLPNVDEAALFRLQFKLPRGSDTRLALLRALFDANWTSRTSDLSPMWLNLTEALVERGRRDEARAVAKRIVGPMQLVALRSDKRFDYLVQDDSWTFNIDNAARRQVETLRQQSDLSPRSLDARAQYSYALLTAGLDREALELNEETKRRIAAAPADQPPYDDLHEQVWLMNNAAIALRRMGRTDEGMAELERASRLTEEGLVNVSQTINLAVAYCSLDRPADALAAVDRVGEAVTGYASLIVEGVRLCAATGKNERGAANKALRYLREHRGDGNLVYLEALLRTQRLDEAAQLLAELLAAHDERLETLVWLQDYRRAEPLPGDVAYREARKSLLAREDVQAEVAKVGRIARYEVYGVSEMD